MQALNQRPAILSFGNKLNEATASGPALLLYWGRRGLSRFAFDLAGAMKESGPLLSISRQNESAASFTEAFGDALFAVDTFEKDSGAVFRAWKIPLLRAHIRERFAQCKPAVVIDLLPHIWMPFILPEIRRAGVRYVTIAHDADVHPGDYRTRLVKLAADHVHGRADHVVALSETVARRLVATRIVAPERVTTLFHPDLRFGDATPPKRAPRPDDQPIRLAFLGRIMPYKGLSLFVDTMMQLRAQGLDIACGVFGEGPLGAEKARLDALGAEIVNRWLDESEMANVLARHDALVASHTEASQSGVVAAALGAGLPVIATPVGGLIEQIEDGVTGVIARAADATGLAEAISRLFETPGLSETIASTIESRRNTRSMERFAEGLLLCAASAVAHPDRQHKV